ncbi:zinc finger protein [Fusarium albosuccineum]|uniref:Zinc finger protein n=1 Tax=Fusarium albosuccineum TaxID=1237068 RepID=A0A8H4KQ52_9HYPO|nr:zinc finger protein [Fusarium albosuccineum]
MSARTRKKGLLFAATVESRTPASMDLVTRHERTLHARAHQKRQNQESEHTSRVHVACPTPDQPVEPAPQPADELEPGQESDCLNTQDLSVRDAPLNQAQGNIPTQQTESYPMAASTAPGHEYPSLPAAHTLPQAGPGYSFSTSNTVLPLSQEINDNGETLQQQTHYQPESSGSEEQDQSRFFFSPIPTFDIDLAAFIFSPSLNQPAQHHRDLSASFITGDLTLQNQPEEDMHTFSGLNSLPLQTFNHQNVSDESTTSSDALKSQSTDPVLPLLCENRHPHPAIVLDDVAYESIRRDLAQCLAGSDTDLDIPPARAAFPPPDGHQALVQGFSLWFVQTRILLAFYAVMSGEKDLLMSTLQSNGIFTLVYNKARIALAADNTDPSHMSWHKWIEHESWKRSLGGLLVISTLIMVLFDVNPGFNATQDLEFEIFDDEAMWNAESSTEWRQIRNSNPNQQHGERHRTMKEVLPDIMLEGRCHSSKAPYQVSAFSALVLMHGAVVHMWQRLQVCQAFAEPSSSTLISDTGSDALGSSLLDGAMRALERCGNFLKGTESQVNSLGGADEETSLAFNCQAMLRIAYIRLFKPINASKCLNLMDLDPEEMDEAITLFATTKMERGPRLLDAVIHCFEGLRIPVKLGYMFVRKTAALRWSVEHAVAGWESGMYATCLPFHSSVSACLLMRHGGYTALLVTKWIDSVEVDNSNGTRPSSQERELLTLIKSVLEEAEYDLGESVSLAAATARTWASFLQDVSGAQTILR